ncbi:MAG: hypothetical protein FJ098_16315 [Deltaproteobacteria bacterium]|nr:hypothetical protein [Deltaproteobacteria bacterium]
MRTLLWPVSILLALMLAACDGGGGGGGGGGGDDLGTDSRGSGDGGILEDGLLPDGTPGDDGSLPDAETPPDGLPGDGVGDLASDAEDPSGLSDSFVEKACFDWCQLQDACGDGIQDVDLCAQDCAAAVDGGAPVGPMVCVSMGWNPDDINCEALELCAEPLAPEACTDFCGSLKDCGFFIDETSETFGTSVAECEALCGAYATRSPEAEFEASLACAGPAAAACDFLGLMECLDPGGSDECEDLCGDGGLVTECGLVPEVFPGLEDCQTWCDNIGPGGAVAAEICFKLLLSEPGEGPFGDQGTCQELVPPKCIQPATELPDGLTDYCKALTETCGDEPGFPYFPTPDVCGWVVMGIRDAAPEGLLLSDFSAAAACAEEQPSCSEGAWFSCLVDVYEPAQAACEALMACMEEMPPESVFTDVPSCVYYVTLMHLDTPLLVEEVVACIDLAPDCGAVLACVPGGDV